jgi:hypothetical protein
MGGARPVGVGGIGPKVRTFRRLSLEGTSFKNHYRRMEDLEDIGEILIKRGKKSRISVCNFEKVFSYNLTVKIFTDRFKWFY